MKNLLIIFLLTGIFTEITLRVLRPQGLEFYRIQKVLHKFDDNYFIDLEPNIHVNLSHFLGYYTMNFSTNEFGFRGTKQINNQLPQIGCIGDSVIMGFGVNDEDTFCSKLDNFTTDGKIYQSVNMGVDAYGPAAITNKLEKYIPKLNLKLVYYLPNAGDDIDDELYYQRKANSFAFFLFKSQFLLTKYSYLFLGLKIAEEQMKYRFLETFVWPLKKINKTIACNQNQLTAEECQDVYRLSFTEFISDFTVSHPPLEDKPISFPPKECVDIPDKYPIPDKMMQDINTLIELTEKNNMQLVFILAPTDIETAWCSQQNKSHRYFSYLASLKEILSKRNLPFIDLTEYTNRMVDDKNRKNPRPYYIIGDGHYTVKGNEWVAKILQDKTPGFLQYSKKLTIKESKGLVP